MRKCRKCGSRRNQLLALTRPAGDIVVKADCRDCGADLGHIMPRAKDLEQAQQPGQGGYYDARTGEWRLAGRRRAEP